MKTVLVTKMLMTTTNMRMSITMRATRLNTKKVSAAHKCQRTSFHPPGEDCETIGEHGGSAYVNCRRLANNAALTH